MSAVHTSRMLTFDCKQSKPASMYMMEDRHLHHLWRRANCNRANPGSYYRLVPIDLPNDDTTWWILISMGDGNRWTSAMKEDQVVTYLRNNRFGVVEENVAFEYLNNTTPAEPPVKKLGVTLDSEGEDGYEIVVDKDGLKIGCQRVSFSEAERIVEEMRSYLSENGIPS